MGPLISNGFTPRTASRRSPQLSTPVLGAINGAAITGGMEMALGCDFLVASDRAVFADTHALLLKRALVSTPALEGRNLAIQRDFQNRIALTLAQRRGLSQPDDASLVAAAITQAVMHLAFDRWAANGGRDDLQAALHRLFDLVAAIPSR
jgi:Enoyl-CoA hydratase/isomerase/MftR C-terminal domain